MPDAYRPLKNAFGKFATGIAVAACKTPAGGYCAITINSFTSVSLEPALVLWCLETKANAYPLFMETQSYSVSILPAEAQDLSNRFAGHEPAPLQSDEYELWESGSPILRSRIAGFDCRIHSRNIAGDHVVLVGEVLRFDTAEGRPLIYFASQYHTEV